MTVAAGSHLLWSDPDDPERTSLALDRDPSRAGGAEAAGVAPSTSSPTTSASPTEEPAPTTATEPTSTTPEEEDSPESSSPPPSSSSSPSDDSTTTDDSSGDAAPTVARDGSQDSGGTGTRQRVVELVNAERAEAGCATVRVDDRLVESAQAHSDDMAAGGYLSHTSQDGRSFDERIEAAGYPDPAAENIAMGMSTADAVMQAWMSSEGHRRNILNCEIATIGVGVNPDGWYWTQNFGY
nr:CAP domain-containing protein [Saccharomonospora cyanea]